MSFCFFCGTAPCFKVGDVWHCTVCQGQFRIQITKEAQLTLEEAQAAFNAIPIPEKKRKRGKNVRYQVS